MQRQARGVGYLLIRMDDRETADFLSLERSPRCPPPDYNRRQQRYEYRAQRMMHEGGGRLSEAASCLGCLLKLVVGIVIFMILLAVAFNLYYHFLAHRVVHF